MRSRHLDPLPDYPPGVGRFVAMLTDTRTRLLSDLESLEVTHLDRIPVGSPNSVGTLLYHIAAIELDWLYADLLERDFPAAAFAWFPVDVREEGGRLTPVVEPYQRHLARLEWVRGLLLTELRELSDADLDRTVNPGPQESGASWVLHHLMQHEAEHRGQIGEIRAGLGG